MVKMKRIIGKIILFGILTFAMVLSGAVTSYAYTADTQVLPATVTTPSDGCVFVGIKGDYIAEAEKALARINEIRLEACREGVPNPGNPSQRLTEADYVPIKWSASLEAVARIRAAEASLVISHTRPNGKSCFTISARDIWGSGEVLAWNFSSSMLDGIEQWYEEKGDWVKQNSSAVTGHYTQMIDPKNTHVGLGCMVTDNGIYYNTTCGRFGVSAEGVDMTAAPAVKGCIQVIEIQKSALSGTTLERISKGSVDKLKVGDTVSYELMTRTNLEGYKAKALVVGNIQWLSSDSNVATVDAYGNVTGVGEGTVTITAISDGGVSARVSLTFADLKAPTVSKVKSLKATAGTKKLTITWKKLSGAAGYELQVSTKSSFKGAKTVKISKSKKQYVAKKLKAKKKYYVRIRAYKTYKDARGKIKKTYGEWVKVSKKTK